MRTAVLDTNIVLDLFVFDDQAARVLKHRLEASEFQWLATQAMRDELERVLAYPKIAPRVAYYKLDTAQVLASFDRHTCTVEPAPQAGVTCKDADDQKFIDLAVAHRSILLSKDAAVLTRRKRLAALGVQAAPQQETTQ